MASSELTEVKTILGILSDTRAEHYDSWFIIGSILYNLSKGKEPGISLWHDFTKRGTMFSKEDCNDKWSTMRKSPYSIRMLFQYAQQDHMQCFEEYKINRSKKKLKEACRSIDTGEYVFAEALYYLCCDEFTYNDSWYQYKDNTWTKTKNCMELKKKIQCLKGFIIEDNKLLRDRRTIVSDLIRDKEDENEMDQADTIRMEVKTIENKLAIYTVVLEKLNTAGFKNAIMSECKELFYDDTIGIEKTNDTESINNIDTIIYNKNSSPIELFVKYLITKDKLFINQEKILLSSSELMDKFNIFIKYHNIDYNVNTISLCIRLKNLNIKGIKTGINTNKCKKTEFIKKDIIDYFRIV
jgi:hypothetical protein